MCDMSSQKLLSLIVALNSLWIWPLSESALSGATENHQSAQSQRDHPLGPPQAAGNFNRSLCEAFAPAQPKDSCSG